jgi:predicted transcriptional regulator
MCNAFLSYYQLKDYLTIMIDDELLKHDLDSQRFRITEKGLTLLKLCDPTDKLIEKR